MKKSTLEAIRNYLNGDETIDLTVVRDEVNSEWERLNARPSARRLTPIVSARLSAMHGSARRSPSRNWLNEWEQTSHISLALRTVA